MNRTFIIYTLVFVISFSGKLESKKVVSIHKAFEKKYISAKAVCRGGLELDYMVTNLLKDSLMISIPPGWRFNSNAGKNDYQDILVVREEMLVLKPGQVKTFDIKGYCCEASKSGPQKGAIYTLGKLADSNLVALARYLSRTPMDANTEQYSVWAISDGEETANISNANDSLASLLRTFVAGLKGEPLPWYTMIKKARITPYGEVIDTPLKFKADITYSISKASYAYCYIVDSSGQKVSEIFGRWLFPDNSDYSAGFNVVGLKKGDYRLILETQNATLFDRAFKI
jgi:hypothetical protein